MILPITEVDTIKHIQKAHTSHITAFESIFERLDRQDREEREKAKKERELVEKKKKQAERENAERKKKAEKAKRDKILRENREREQRAAQERQMELERQELERKAREERELAAASQRGNQQTATNELGTSWASVSPQDAAAYMASKTGVAQSVWEGVIYRESSNNPTIVNSIGCYGYLQLHPVHGNAAAMTPQQYLDKAVEVFHSQGAGAWEAW